MKECSICKELKPLTEFFVNHCTKDGRNTYCKKCQYIKYGETQKQRRLQTKLALIKELGGKCVRCGYDKCPAALEFHHKDPSQKDFGISEYMRSKTNDVQYEELLKEASKCELLCANCHKEEHFTLNKLLEEFI